jgi:DNA-binding CsgD family transcriptional regulator
MLEEGALAWLQSARTSLVEMGLQPVALVALDRPTIAGRTWTDGSLQPNQLQDLLATYATELAAHGLLDGARMAAPFARQLATTSERALAVMAAPRHAPRVAAVVRASPGTDFNAVSEALSKAVPRDDTVEMAAALCEVTGAAATLLGPNGIEFASRSAFLQQGAPGPFLGLACLSRQVGEALGKLQRLLQEQTAVTSIRREQIGPYTMACFVKRLGENNLAQAASRFGLTRAELAESESMIAGLSCKESASRLKISPETVRQRRKVIYRKLGVESCGTAVARILELELPPPPPPLVDAASATSSPTLVATSTNGGSPPPQVHATLRAP